MKKGRGFHIPGTGLITAARHSLSPERAITGRQVVIVASLL